jgi:hypothetical protein
MAIQLGSTLVSEIFIANTFRDNYGIPLSGSVIGLQSGSYSNGETWSSTTGSPIPVVNSPLIGSASNGRWQFNGTNEYFAITQSILNANFDQTENIVQVFTFLLYGTIGSLATPRALFGAGGFSGSTSYTNGGDAILRTDTSPGAGKIHLDLRGRGAGGGNFTRYTITGTSGSLLNLAILSDNNGSSSVYQDGVLVAMSSSAGFFGYCPWRSRDGDTSGTEGCSILFNNDTDAENYNGQLGGCYLYNRALSSTEISHSAQAFYKGNTFGTTVASTASAVFIGSNQVYPNPTTTTTTTTTSTTTTRPPLSVMTLVVGGGGAGGVGTAGGGGAGGLRTGSFSLTASTYTVTVGAGGAGSAGPVGVNNSTQSGNPGETSSFSTLLVSFGGGGGLAYEGTQNFSNGGSGGGPSDTRLRQPAGGSVVLGGSGSAGQGNAGGNGTFGAQFGNGGGGAGQAGQNGNSGTNPRRAGAGGSGSLNSFRDGNATFYAGGGGGGGYNTAIAGLGGPGGGASGGAAAGSGTAPAGGTGSANTGGGGGGSSRNAAGTSNGIGGAGGSGIVVIAYLTSSFSASAATAVSGGIITDYTSGSQVYRSHTFLSSSNLVIS